MLTPDQIARNATLEEAASNLDLKAGEGFNDGACFHYCAKETRRLKDCPECGNRMSPQWTGKDWKEHQCAPS
jgi:primosomal protein N'